MAQYKTDLRERAKAFGIAAYKVSYGIQERYPGLRNPCTQMCRAASSIGANLTEGEGLNSRRELAARYAIAMREARETKYWLELIQGAEPQMAGVVAPLYAECKELIAMTTAALRKLRSPPPP